MRERDTRQHESSPTSVSTKVPPLVMPLGTSKPSLAHFSLARTVSRLPCSKHLSGRGTFLPVVETGQEHSLAQGTGTWRVSALSDIGGKSAQLPKGDLFPLVSYFEFDDPTLLVRFGFREPQQNLWVVGRSSVLAGKPIIYDNTRRRRRNEVILAVTGGLSSPPYARNKSSARSSWYCC